MPSMAAICGECLFAFWLTASCLSLVPRDLHAGLEVVHRLFGDGAGDGFVLALGHGEAGLRQFEVGFGIAFFEVTSNWTGASSRAESFEKQAKAMTQVARMSGSAMRFVMGMAFGWEELDVRNDYQFKQRKVSAS